jgi:hypothetical protein
VLLAEQGEMCLDQLKSLSDRGMAIMKNGMQISSRSLLYKIIILCIILADEKQEKNLKIVMLDINMMEILFKIFKLNVRTISPDKFVFDPVIHAHKVVS